MTDVTPGLCTCGTRVLRATDENGIAHTVNAALTNAVAELQAWTNKRPSYTIDGRPRDYTMTPRTTHDIATKPAGFTPARIFLTHQCPNTKSDDTEPEQPEGATT